MFNPRFLVVSLGNPHPFAETLHSAGHMCLYPLQEKLRLPPFSLQRYGKTETLASVDPISKYTLLQCPTVMNVSGPWVATVWKETLAKQNLSPADLSLVVVHDDLEERLGAVKLRSWNASHRGHNGIKSILSKLQPGSYQAPRWSRISVGIGRPEERDEESVSDYVLSDASVFQKTVFQDEAGPRILHVIGELEQRWGREQAAEKRKQK